MTVELTQEQVTLINTYKQEAYGQLADIQTATDQLKEIVEAAADKTGVAKADIAAYFKAAFKAETAKTVERAALFERLSQC